MKLEGVPPRIARLPRDSRGYPIPWNVLMGADGITPLFTVNDQRQHQIALAEGRCPICGESLERTKWFVGGPRSAFDPNGWYFDLPAHGECVEFALRTCPYLAAPKYLGRIDIVDPSKVPTGALLMDATQIPERPTLFIAVACRKIEVRRRGPLLPYVRPVRPLLGIQYWRWGERLSDGAGEQLTRGVMGLQWRPPKVRKMEK